MGDMPIIRTGHCGPHGTFFGAACPLCAMAISGVDPRDARIAELEAALAAARADYEGLEWYAAYVVRAYDSDVAHGITPSLGIYNTVRQLESCGRPGWVERALGRRK